MGMASRTTACRDLTNPGNREHPACRKDRQIKNKPLEQQDVRTYVYLEIMKYASAQINITNSEQPECYSSCSDPR
jgi:hypothetical protein